MRVLRVQIEKVRARNLEFSVDRSFSTNASQEDVYNIVARELVDKVLAGYNTAILAYGQTGSGKTYTMLGPTVAKPESSSKSTVAKPESSSKSMATVADSRVGIVPRACMQLFAGLPKGYRVALSYLEVYNESVNDCLDESGEIKYLPLREVSAGHVEAEGLTQLPVADVPAVLRAIARGDSRRIVAAMAMNPRSSRGHGLIALNVHTADGLPHGRLTLVDLAGMESSKKSPPEGASNVIARRQEAKAINTSLLALSGCISALAAHSGAMRVPYRDSKLTRLLQSSLAGTCKAAIIVTLRCEAKNTDESIHSLRFAQRAKAVEATVVKNEDLRALTTQRAGAVNRKLEAELGYARQSLAEFETRLASAETYKATLMAQVQTLLAEMQSLQRDAETARREQAAQAVREAKEAKEAQAAKEAALEAKEALEAKQPAQAASAARGGAQHNEERPKSAVRPKSAGYVRSLERRLVELEEENRLLRQRDIMRRLVSLEGSSDEPSPKITPRLNGTANMGIGDAAMPPAASPRHGRRAANENTPTQAPSAAHADPKFESSRLPLRFRFAPANLQTFEPVGAIPDAGRLFDLFEACREPDTQQESSQWFNSRTLAPAPESHGASRSSTNDGEGQGTESKTPVLVRRRSVSDKHVQSRMAAIRPGNSPLLVIPPSRPTAPAVQPASLVSADMAAAEKASICIQSRWRGKRTREELFWEMIQF